MQRKFSYNNTSAKKRILILLPGMNLRPSGGYKVIFEIAQRLNEIGFFTEIHFLKSASLIRMESKDISLHDAIYILIEFCFNVCFGSRYGSYLLSALKKVLGIPSLESIQKLPVSYSLRHLFDDRFDIIIVTNYLTALYINQLNPSERRIINFIQQEDDSPYNNKKFSQLAHKSYYLNYKKIVINNQMAKRYLSDLSDEERILSKVKIGIDHNLYKMRVPLNMRNAKTVLFQLKTGTNKGLDLALEIIDRLKEKVPDVIISSFGTRSIPLPSFVNHFGTVSTSRLVELYNSNSIFVLPSRIEGFPRPALEAAACGCLVASFDNGGTGDWIEDDYNGILVRNFDIHSMVLKLTKIISNPEKLQSMVTYSLFSTREYTNEKMFESFLKAIE